MIENKRPECRWILKTQNEETVLDIAEYLKEIFKNKKKKSTTASEESRNVFFELLARLLYNRGIREPNRIFDFFNTTSSRLIDPFLMPDMEKAVDRINKALADNEKITIYGDYDVDGITSVSVLYKYLLSCGANVDYYIPGRTDEGYGLNEHALNKIHETGTTLLITVDTGTTAVDEVIYAESIGIQTVITDHHECKLKINEDGTVCELIPQCVAVVNPKRPSGEYPFSDLAGVGVVFKLLCALTGKTDEILDLYGDLVAIGTIADIMPLVNENRTIVLNGIKKIKEHMSVGLKALLSVAGSEKAVSSSVIAYTVAPRLNAAGRIGDPKTSIRLLLETDYTQAVNIATALCEENKRRQQLESEIFKDVEKMIAESNADDKIFVFASDEWHHGVIGIVASRIIEKYGKPCVLLCADGENMKGSARSVKGISIFELLQQVSFSLLKFGGHEMAAGLSLSRDQYQAFKDGITEYANKTITDKMLVPSIEAECELPFEMLTLQTYDVIRMLEPFGTGNVTPLFIIKDLSVVDIEPIGNGNHAKLKIAKKDFPEAVTMLMFNVEFNRLNCVKGDTIDIICALGDNVFNGKRSLSVNIKKFKLSTAIESKDKVSKLFYDNFRKNGKIINDIVLNREYVAAVYKKIRKQSSETEEYNAYSFARRISVESGLDVNYARFMLSLDILNELELISFTGTEYVKITYKNTPGKVDLQNSVTWGRVHQ